MIYLQLNMDYGMDIEFTYIIVLYSVNLNCVLIHELLFNIYSTYIITVLILKYLIH